MANEELHRLLAWHPRYFGVACFLIGHPDHSFPVPTRQVHKSPAIMC